MIKINNYIFEKLKINKDSKLSNKKDDLINCIKIDYKDCISTLINILRNYDSEDFSVYINKRHDSFKKYRAPFISVNDPYIQEKWMESAGKISAYDLKKYLRYRQKPQNNCTIYHIDDYIFIFTEEYDLLIEKDDD